jgi:hypothetical protein
MHRHKTPAAPPGELVDAIMDGYVSWREASAAAAAEYRRWTRASPRERAGAFDGYRAALDREERAAAEYQRLVERLRPA